MGRNRRIINLKLMNKSITYIDFKMDGGSLPIERNTNARKLSV